MFRWVLEVLAEKGLLKGKTVGIDATTLEANAAMRSIVRRDTGEGYQEFLRRLAQESGIATPTREQLARLDRKRTKKGSNEDWVNPHDPDARITKMKDGRTHLAYKAEHAVDLETGAVVAVTVATGDAGDTATVLATLPQAGETHRRGGVRDEQRRSGRTSASGGSGGSGGGQGLSQQRHAGGAGSKRKCGRISRSRIADGGTGKASRKRKRRCTPIGGGFGASAGRGCCGGGARSWNAASRMRMKPAGCGACICADERIFSSEC